MKIKLNWDGELYLNKVIGILFITIIVRAVFHENNKYYPQAFLDECLHKICNIEMESKDELKGINIKYRTCYYLNSIIKDVGISYLF